MPKKSLKTEKLTFPKRLFNVVNSSEYISWAEDGESFYINDLQQFESKVMKVQFNNTTLLSFFRQVQLYGFKRIVDGRKTRYQMRTNNAYFQHPDFKRGMPELLSNINREKRKRNIKPETECSSKPKLAITKYIPYRAEKEKKKSMRNKSKKTTNQTKVQPTKEIQAPLNNSLELQVCSSTSAQSLNNTFHSYISSQDTNVLAYQNPIYCHDAALCPPQLPLDSFNLIHTINSDENEIFQGTIPTQSESYQAYNPYRCMNTHFPYNPFNSL